MDTLQGHFHQWGAVLFFAILYGVALYFVPFYKKMDRKPATAYLAFVLAFAIEMHGIPMSMYLISWVIGKSLPEGVLWGHTLVGAIGHTGMYLSVLVSLIGIYIIGNGWYHIYHKYWSQKSGKGQVVTTGVYRYIRHPQYTGLMLLCFGMILNWATLPLLLGFPFVIAMYYRLAKREERDMINEFGEEYIMYMNKTKRFIPFLV